MSEASVTVAGPLSEKGGAVKLQARYAVGEFGWIWIATAALFLLSAVVAPGTVRLASLIAMLPFAAMLAIVAVGQTIVIQQRGLDLSSAGLMSLGGILVAQLGFSTGSLLLASFLTLVICAICGAINGLLVARLSIMPIVATLATNSLLLGAIHTLSGGSPMTVPKTLETFSHELLLGIPYTLFLSLAFVAFAAFLSSRTLIGRRFIAVGANPRSSLASGISVMRYQVGTYAAAALCFSVAGMLYAGFIGSASQAAGNDYLLPGIAAVVVGGTPFTGGRGSVIASGVAAIFMTQLGIMVLALGAGTAVQLLVQAGVIVLATTIRHVPALPRRLR
ncbi:ABC transporter permease [Mesorhizobium sp. CO1-1-8]|uniref:ABC transporter permease n=1 Tax=Mesorhizobium sp. CO1-1-8 TaxID=2876631 RepID=UPI001CD191F0|nr:ABC transporter permease [Mesorhizobium sp. CO1-1-8]MBZ9772371.1 ABC transporter permease [Mesorhizobium sp. CO1-1-8]